MKWTGTILLAVVATALVASAKPSHSNIAALLLRQSGSNLHARSGIDPSSIAPQCQPVCTTIIKTLDACTGPSCECTQTNYDALGVCINCLIALGPPLVISPGSDYLNTFIDACSALGFKLNEVSITATPTGLRSTGDPFSMFEAPTPTSGVFFSVAPLIPTPANNAKPSASNATTPTNNTTTPTNNAKEGSAIGLNAYRALGTSMAVATAAAIVLLGVSCL